ncbi:hypothetical protein [Halogeometricum rufum]|uniref:hypothetical protein n=1 Tax=Halogeometricum rufum TaxID=553469 RepID=UPI001160B8C9|nr:hypothetical protein [Halogeometricum rufum]
MSRIPTIEEWIEEIDEKVSDFENFTSNHAHKESLRETLEEVESILGPRGVERVASTAVEHAENNRHPTADYVRGVARQVVIEEYDEEIPPGSSLLRSRNG